MRRLSDEAAALEATRQNEMLVLDEAFLQRVDRAMLQRKQADPFQREAVWRATEEEVRMKRLQPQREDLTRSKPR
jgi:hypothetical protein